MATLLLRLAGPLQAWGTDSKFEVRKTNREPSKSGVIGLLAAALGRSRADTVSDLAALKFGVRVDREGEILRDFHMVCPMKASKKRGALPYMTVPPQEENRSKSWLTNRYYLSDAVFLVGLESDNEDLLHKLDNALRNPKYPLFLGRRACAPEFPMALGIRDNCLFDALKQEPWTVSSWSKTQWERRNGGEQPELRVVMDADPSADNYAFATDLPVSFNPMCREHTIRCFSEVGFISLPAPDEEEVEDEILHDPMSELI